MPKGGSEKMYKKDRAVKIKYDFEKVKFKLLNFYTMHHHL